MSYIRKHFIISNLYLDLKTNYETKCFKGAKNYQTPKTVVWSYSKHKAERPYTIYMYYRAYMYCTRQNPKLRVKFATLLPLREVLPLYPVILLNCLVTLDCFLGFPLYKMLISTLSPTFQLSIEIYHKWYLNYCKAPHLGLGSNRLGRFKS